MVREADDVVRRENAGERDEIRGKEQEKEENRRQLRRNAGRRHLLDNKVKNNCEKGGAKDKGTKRVQGVPA